MYLTIYLYIHIHIGKHLVDGHTHRAPISPPPPPHLPAKLVILLKLEHYNDIWLFTVLRLDSHAISECAVSQCDGFGHSSFR